MAAINTSKYVEAFDTIVSTPQYAHLVEHFANALPVSYRDQAAAANDDVCTVLNVIAAATGGTPRGFNSDAVPDWLRLSLIDVWLRYGAGTIDTCMHSPDLNQPQPVTATAWKPNLITCMRCLHLTEPRPGSVADRTCDCCGRVCEGPDVGDLMYPGSIVFGSLLFRFGTCTDCRPMTLL